MLSQFIVLILLKSSLCFLDFPSPIPLLDDVLQSLGNAGDKRITKTLTPGLECNRKCDESEPKVCYFHWFLEVYPSLGGACKNCSHGVFEDCLHPQCVTGNGRERIFMSINRQLPGPPVEVCKHDLVVVDVVNEIEGSGTTIHWHGLAHMYSLFMDGVPYITQCPIHFGSTFRYTFEASEDGSYFYHSHAGHQKANGVYGAFIVRRENDQQSAYDLSEHVIVLADWMNELTEDSFPGVKSKNSHPHSLLINGRGRFSNITDTSVEGLLSVFHVDEGNSYKFRIVGASSNVCPLQLQFEGHNFTVVAADATPIKPFIADTLFVVSGERFDVIIQADQKKKDSFWIRLKAVDPCLDLDSVEEFAVLKYHRKGEEQDSRPSMMQVDEKAPSADAFISLVQVNSPIPTAYPITDLESFITDEGLIDSKPDRTFFLSFETPVLQNSEVFSGRILHKFFGFSVPDKPDMSFNSIGTINRISFISPKVPLLSQHHEIDKETFCNETYMGKAAECYEDGHCFCTHRLMAPERSLVEFVLINSGILFSAMTHPFHLHGHHFAVIEVGNFNDTFTEDDLRQHLHKVKPTKKNPVYKDTVFIPKNGFARLRYRSRDASLLFFHCHYDFHLSIGMAGVLQIGHLSDMPKPPENFPQCRHYTPKI